MILFEYAIVISPEQHHQTGCHPYTKPVQDFQNSFRIAHRLQMLKHSILSFVPTGIITSFVKGIPNLDTCTQCAGVMNLLP